MAVQPEFAPTFSAKLQGALKGVRTVRSQTFIPSDAKPKEILKVHVPKVGSDEVIVPGSLALVFDVDLTGGHANNHLVKNFTRALISKMVVYFGDTEIMNLDSYDLYKIYKDLFLTEEERSEMLLEGI